MDQDLGVARGAEGVPAGFELAAQLEVVVDLPVVDHDYARRWLDQREEDGEEGRFDLVFIDAPYRLADRVGQELDTRLPRLLSDSGRAIIESGARQPLRIESLPRLRQRRYGAADVSIYGSAEQ